MTEQSRARFAALARSPEPDLARLCLLIGCEADPGLYPGAAPEAGPGGEAASGPAAGPDFDLLNDLTGGLTGDLADDLGGDLGGGPSGGPNGPLGAAPGSGADWEPEPGSAFARRLGELDRLAAAVRAAGPPGDAPAAVAARLAGVLAGRAEFRGGSGAYRRLDSSLLHRVLERRRGLPILLSVVWVEVGRRAGLPVYPVALPGHFVVGVGDPEGEFVLADPFHGGRLLTTEDAAAIAAQSGTRLTSDLLSPAEPLDIVLRVLNNIRAWAAARPEHARVQLWAVELSLLLPRHPAQLRLERAELLVKLGDFLTGAAEMEGFAKILDAFDPESAARVRLDAKAARHRLN